MRVRFHRRALAALLLSAACVVVMATPASAAIVDIDGRLTDGTLTVDTMPVLSYVFGGTPPPNPCTSAVPAPPDITIAANDVVVHDTDITAADFDDVYVKFGGRWWLIETELGAAADNEGFISPSGYTFQDIAIESTVYDLGTNPSPPCPKGGADCTYNVYGFGLLGWWATLPPSQGDDVSDYNGDGFAFSNPGKYCRPNMTLAVPGVDTHWTNVDFTSAP